MSKTGALIQVRQGSQRLPNKAFVNIDGKPLIQRCIDSLLVSKVIDEIIITTGAEEENPELVKFAQENGISYFCGDSLNVLDRFYQAAKHFNIDNIIRVTGDCPLVSHEIIELLFKNYKSTNADYLGIEYGEIPIGTGSEFFTFHALERLMTYDLDFSLSEYLTYYFRYNDQYFNINLVDPPQELCFPNYRLTLDFNEDLDIFKAIFKYYRKSGDSLSLKNTINFLNSNQKIANSNKNLAIKYIDDKKLSEKIKNASIIRPISE